MPPYLARITISGDTKMTGVFEECMDLAAARRSAQARAKARPAGAPPSLTGCTTAYEMRPDGSIHHEMSCDQSKGAKASFRLTSDGTANDLRVHTERRDTAAAGSKPTIFDSHMVRLGPCPADLKPGEMRRPGGPILKTSEASRLLDSAQGTAR